MKSPATVSGLAVAILFSAGQLAAVQQASPQTSFEADAALESPVRTPAGVDGTALTPVLMARPLTMPVLAPPTLEPTPLLDTAPMSVGTTSSDWGKATAMGAGAGLLLGLLIVAAEFPQDANISWSDGAVIGFTTVVGGAVGASTAARTPDTWWKDPN